MRDLFLRPRRWFAMIPVAAALALAWSPAPTPAPEDPAADDASAGPLEGLVTIKDIRRLMVSTSGDILHDGPVVRDECTDTVTHTDANFTGGSYLAQLGFAQGESFAATYNVDPALFPIKIDAMECIFVTQNALVQTTTQWTVSVWEGIPTTGTLVASYSSDDLILPHVVIPPGTNGVNLVVTIDPSDPEQIIIDNAGGSNQFTVAFRIDRHNLPPGNPCSPPDSQRNAFPCVDTSGRAAPTLNWIRAIACAGGCPSGWNRFSDYPAICRPSGDWVMRATYTSFNCSDPIGACCKTDGTCEILTADLCASAGGTYQGDDTTCGGVSCPPPTVACCFESSGGCLNLSEANCIAAGGVPAGAGTNCTSHTCFPMGACCMPTGSCIDDVSPDDCTAAGGVFQGNDTTCATVSCPDPEGACCFATGFCLVLEEADCAAAGATWHGFGTTCDDINGNGTADICEAGGSCDGDVDSDSDIDLTDLSLLLAAFGTCTGNGQYNPDADFDTSGCVDLSDLSVQLAVFGTTCP